MTNLYLILDLAALAGPVFLSFDKRVQFFRNWKFVLLACTFVGIPFILWDVLFTSHGIWGFNNEYLVGFMIGGLPIEEILFFIVVPFACTFIYECCKYYLKESKRFDYGVMLFLMTYAATLILLNPSGLYSVIAGSVFILCAIWWLRLKITHVGYTFLFSMLPFLVMNGILTGYATEQPVVWYNNIDNCGYRIATIPVEDVVYGASLIFTTIFVYELLKKKWSK